MNKIYMDIKKIHNGYLVDTDNKEIAFYKLTELFDWLIDYMQETFDDQVERPSLYEYGVCEKPKIKVLDSD